MKIIAKKTGRFAHPTVSKPHHKFITGESYEVGVDVPDAIATNALKSGWAVDAGREPHGANWVSGAIMTGFDSLPPDTTNAQIIKMIVDGATSNKEAKEALEVWGKQNLGIDIDKRKSLENIIKELNNG